jgi:hypothetical protein
MDRHFRDLKFPLRWRQFAPRQGPIGLARRSDELCHSHGLAYQVRVSTDRQSTAESVESVVMALQQAGLLSSQDI